MDLTVTQLGEIKKIALVGRLDLLGAQSVDQKFTAQAAAAKAFVVVDLSAVDFIASIGIRTLISAAKAQKARGGKLVLFAPQPMVKQVLVTSGVSIMVPVADDETAALALVQA